MPTRRSMNRKEQMEIDGNPHFAERFLGAAILAVVAIAMGITIPLTGQSTDAQSSSSQNQASQKPDQVPAEAGGPGGEVGPMAVPKKKDSTDDTPPPPKPKKQADIPE